MATPDICGRRAKFSTGMDAPGDAAREEPAKTMRQSNAVADATRAEQFIDESPF